MKKSIYKMAILGVVVLGCLVARQQAFNGVSPPPPAIRIYVDGDNTTSVEDYPDASKGDLGNDERTAQNSSDEENYPGVIVPANTIDTNENGVIGYADGIDKFGNGNVGACWKFAPLLIDASMLASYPNAQFKIHYSASDPDQMTHVSGGNYELPAAGDMRIWKKDGDEIRKPQSADQTVGDFVKDDHAYSAAQLGWSSGQTYIRLYIEPVTGIADASYVIRVTFYPNGTNDPETTSEDQVKVAPFYVGSTNKTIEIF